MQLKCCRRTTLDIAALHIINLLCCRTCLHQLAHKHLGDGGDGNHQSVIQREAGQLLQHLQQRQQQYQQSAGERSQ